MGILGSSAISMASQTTRLGKGSSVTTQDECASWRSYYGKIYLKWILKYVIIISFGLLNCTPLFSLFPSSLIFDHLSSAYLLAHNCEISRRSFIFPFVITFVLWSIPFDPHHCSLSLLDVLCSGAQLRRPRQRITCNIWSVQNLATLFREVYITNQCCNRSQKLGVFLNY